MICKKGGNIKKSGGGWGGMLLFDFWHFNKPCCLSTTPTAYGLRSVLHYFLYRLTRCFLTIDFNETYSPRTPECSILYIYTDVTVSERPKKAASTAVLGVALTSRRSDIR